MSNSEKAQKSIDQLMEMMKQDNMGEQVARTYIGKLNEVPSSQWSLNNRLIMALNGYTCGAGYKAWKQYGRAVQGGEKAFYILAPITVKFTTEEPNPETGKMEEVEKQYIKGWRGVPVFGLEQTEAINEEGENLVPEDATPEELPELVDVAEELGLQVEWKAATGPAYGSYNPQEDAVVLNSHDDSVFWHELGHAAHRRVDGELKGGQHPDQEIIAETVAGALSVLYGKEQYIPNVKEYIEHYAQGEDPGKAITKVISKVEKCLDLILSTEEALEEELVA